MVKVSVVGWSEAGSCLAVLELEDVKVSSRAGRICRPALPPHPDTLSLLPSCNWLLYCLSVYTSTIWWCIRAANQQAYLVYLLLPDWRVCD
jgi:hypothetical protein